MNSSKPAAVLFLTFNRPDLFKRVLEVVKGTARRQIFVAIDGPRDSHPTDAALCRETLRVAQEIDWAEDLHFKVEAKNLGCGLGVSSAISWAFSMAPEIIILEDDCLPDPSFMRFCDELLEHYRDDERIMHVCGTNWEASSERYLGCSYAFNSLGPIWGWATWRRAWQLYDFKMESWPRIKSSGLLNGIALSQRFRSILQHEWDQAHAGRGTWDMQWIYCVMKNNGLCISPNVNLVENMGFRPDGTNYSGIDNVFSYLRRNEMKFPLTHPSEVIRNVLVESVFENIFVLKVGWLIKKYRTVVKNEKVRKLLRDVYRTLLRGPLAFTVKK